MIVAMCGQRLIGTAGLTNILIIMTFSARIRGQGAPLPRCVGPLGYKRCPKLIRCGVAGIPKALGRYSRSSTGAAPWRTRSPARRLRSVSPRVRAHGCPPVPQQQNSCMLLAPLLCWTVRPCAGPQRRGEGAAGGQACGGGCRGAAGGARRRPLEEDAGNRARLRTFLQGEDGCGAAPCRKNEAGGGPTSGRQGRVHASQRGGWRGGRGGRLPRRSSRGRRSSSFDMDALGARQQQQQAQGLQAGHRRGSSSDGLDRGRPAAGEDDGEARRAHARSPLGAGLLGGLSGLPGLAGEEVQVGDQGGLTSIGTLHVHPRSHLALS